MTIKLHARLNKQTDGEPFIVRVARGSRPIDGHPDREAYFLEPGQPGPEGYRAYFSTDADISSDRVWPIPDELAYLDDGDIVRISPSSGELWVLYRRRSLHNAMLLTEQCNSNCVMCSQPPKVGDDSHLVNAYLEAIPLMSPETAELGITGGEPTLLGPTLFKVIAACKNFLPQTSLHMLSNGRLFHYLTLCREFAELGHSDLMIGIPLYSDLAFHHDYVVQAAGAFDQTIRGILNLARCNQRVEIRMVLHRGTLDRLPQFARFVARNLPFVDHVALMGLEMMGYVRMNLEALWIDPFDYQEQLCDAVNELTTHRMRVSIYNHQLCVLDGSLWPFARKSISDWKNAYVDACESCAAMAQCGGFFASSSLRRSAHIRPLTRDELPASSL